MHDPIRNGRKGGTLMGMEEKNIEDGYWSNFADTGVFPALPTGEVAKKGDAYVKSLLRGAYNPLMKTLYGEVLAREGRLDAEEMKLHAEAAGWVKPMCFSKKRNYLKKREMAAAYDAFALASSNPLVANIGKEDEEYQKAWAWGRRVKEIYSTFPDSSAQIPYVVEDLCGIVLSSAWHRIVSDQKLFSNVLFWIAKLMTKTRGALMGSELRFLNVLRKIDFTKSPEDCLVRKAMDPKPSKGRDSFPSVIEEISTGVYRMLKARYGARGALLADDRDLLSWAIDLLSSTYGRFDDEWGDFRIGKLYVWMGDVERARGCILPIARKKQSEFWVWDLMSDLFVEHRKTCIARAMMCPADEKYTGPLRKLAAELHLPVEDPEALKDIAKDSEALLLTGLDPVRGVYVNSFVNKDGKHRVAFAVDGGRSLRPVSPLLIGFPKGQQYGSTWWVYVDPVDAEGVIGVRQRIDGVLWDVMPSERVVYLQSIKEKSGSVLHILAKDGNEFAFRGVLPAVESGRTLEAKVLQKSGSQEDTRYVAFTVISENELYVGLRESMAVYYGRSHNGAMLQFWDGQHEYVAPRELFPGLCEMERGRAFRIKYTSRKKDDREIFNVRQVVPLEVESDLLKTYEGRIRLGMTDRDPAFVNHIFIPPDLCAELKGREIADGMPVHGQYVTLAPKSVVDQFGKRRVKTRTCAVSCHALTGDELDRYHALTGSDL